MERAPVYSPHETPTRLLSSSLHREEVPSYLERRVRSRLASAVGDTTPPLRPTSPLDHVDAGDLHRLRSTLPAVYEALLEYDTMLAHGNERYAAKESELMRCIGVGQELLEQMDQLKAGCANATAERDRALRRLEEATTAAAQQQRRYANILAKERSHHERAVHALKDSEGMVNELRHQVASQQLSRDEANLSTASARSTQLEATVLELRAEVAKYADQKTCAEEEAKRAVEKAREAAEVAKRAIVAEAEMEMEKLRRALKRAEEEAALNRDGAAGGMAVEELRQCHAQRVRELETAIAEGVRHLQSETERANRAEAELQRARSSQSGAAGAGNPPAPAQNQAKGVMGDSLEVLAAECGQLREESAALRRKLGEAHSSAQDALDAAHAEKMRLSKELGALRVQLVSIQDGVVLDLQRTNAQLQARLQAAAEESVAGQQLRNQMQSLQRATAELQGQLTEAQEVNAELKRCVQEQAGTLRQREEAEEIAQAGMREKAEEVRQLRTENTKLTAALEGLRQQTTLIQGELQSLSVQAEGVGERAGADAERARELEGQLHNAEAALRLAQQSAAAAEHALLDAQSLGADAEDRWKRRYEGERQLLQEERTRTQELEEQCKELRASVHAAEMKKQSYEHALHAAEAAAKAHRTSADTQAEARARQLEERHAVTTEGYERQLRTYRTQLEALRQTLRRMEEDSEQREGGSAEQQRQCQQLRTALADAEAAQGVLQSQLRESAAAVKTLQTHLSASRADTQAAEAHRRQLEELLVDASSTTPCWEDLSSVLARLQRTLTEKVSTAVTATSTEVAALEEQMSDALRGLVAEVQGAVETCCEAQAQRWANVRRRVLSGYSGVERADSPSSSVIGGASGSPNAAARRQRERRGRSGTMPHTDSETEVGSDAHTDKSSALLLVNVTAHARAARELVHAAYEAASHSRENLSGSLADLQSQLESTRAALAHAQGECALLETTAAERARDAEKERAQWVSQLQDVKRRREMECAALEERLQVQTKRLRALERADQQVETLTRRVAELQNSAETKSSKLLAEARADRDKAAVQLQQSQRECVELQKGLQRLRAEVEEMHTSLQTTSAESQTQAQAQQARIERLERTIREERQRAAVLAEAQDETLQQRTEQLTSDVASLRERVRAGQQGMKLQEEAHQAERKELEAMRRINKALEARLKEIEDDRNPLRQQLHSLLSSEI